MQDRLVEYIVYAMEDGLRRYDTIEEARAKALKLHAKGKTRVEVIKKITPIVLPTYKTIDLNLENN